MVNRFSHRPPWTDNLFAKGRRGGSVGPAGFPRALRMQPRNERFFTLSKAGSNVVESAAILMEFAAAPHERWAKLAKRMRRPARSV